MKIIDWAICKTKSFYLKQIAGFKWRAAKYLPTLLKEERLTIVLGDRADL